MNNNAKIQARIVDNKFRLVFNWDVLKSPSLTIVHFTFNLFTPLTYRGKTCASYTT